MPQDDHSPESDIVRTTREVLDRLENREDPLERIRNQLDDTNELLRQICSDVEGIREEFNQVEQRPQKPTTYRGLPFDLFLMMVFLGLILWRVW